MDRSGYRLVGKDGKVVYFEKRRPKFNQEQLKRKSLPPKIEPVNGDGGKAGAEIRQTVGSEKKRNLSPGQKKDAAIESSAYTLRSVMDNIVKNEDINAMARNVEMSPVGKTIKDFEGIPEVYFENVSSGERLTAKQNQAFLVSRKIDNQRKLDATSTRLSSSASLAKNKYYVQLGSFRSKSKADKLLDGYRDIGTTHQIIESRRRNSTLYRVVIGVFDTNLEAMNAKNKLVDKGHTDVFVFRN